MFRARLRTCCATRSVGRRPHLVVRGQWLFVLSLLLALQSDPVRAQIWPTEVQSVERRLRSPEVAQRQAALRKAATMNPKFARSFVLQGLKDSDPAVQKTAARAAIFCSIPHLGIYVRPWLTGQGHEEQLLAIQVMRIGLVQDDIVALGSVLRSGEKAARERSAEALGRAPLALHESASRELLKGLGDDEPKVRKEVAAALGRVGTEEQAVTLAAHLGDPEAAVREQVVLALGVLGGPAARASLASALSDGTASVVAAAADALGMLRDPEATLPLISLARTEPFSEPQRSAERALVRIGGAAAEQELTRLLVETPPGSSVVSLVQKAGKKALLGTCLELSRYEALSRCASSFIELGGEEEKIWNLHDKGRLSVTQMLGILKGRTSRRASIAALEMLLTEGDEHRALSLHYLSSVPEIPQGVGGELARAQRTQKWNATEVVSVLRLLVLASGDYTATAERYLDSTDLSVRAAAAELWVASGRAGASFIRLLTDPRREVSEGAFRRLSQGMTEAQAAVVFSLLEKGKSGRRALLLESLRGLPPVSSASVQKKLSELFQSARSVERDWVLVGMAATRDPSLALLAREDGSPADLAMAAQLALYYDQGEKVARGLMHASHPRVRAAALQTLGVRGGASDVASLMEVVRQPVGQEPGYVRASALRALARISARGALPPGKALEALSAACDSPHDGERLAALELASLGGEGCGATPWEDLLALDEDELVRKASALSLHRRGASLALRRCETYDVSEEVAELCSRGPSEQVDVELPETFSFRSISFSDPWSHAGPIPTRPVALASPFGMIVMMTDRAGRLQVGPGEYAPVSQALAY